MEDRRDTYPDEFGRRDYDKSPCPFYSSEQHQCVEVEGMKRIIKWGVGIIITVFIACFGYFAHNQDRRNDLLLQMNKEVVGLSKLIEYRVLPKLENKNERQTDIRR